MPVNVHASAVVCAAAIIRSSGDDSDGNDRVSTSNIITIGARTILHPLSIVETRGGPIVLGTGNILKERSRLTNLSTTEPLIIGNDNVISVDAVFEGRSMGNGCIVEVRGHVSAGTTMADRCIVGTGCRTEPADFGSGRDGVCVHASASGVQSVVTMPSATKMTAEVHEKHLHYLADILPKYNRLREGDVHVDTK